MTGKKSSFLCNKYWVSRDGIFFVFISFFLWQEHFHVFLLVLCQEKNFIYTREFNTL